MMKFCLEAVLLTASIVFATALLSEEQMLRRAQALRISAVSCLGNLEIDTDDCTPQNLLDLVQTEIDKPQTLCLSGDALTVLNRILGLIGRKAFENHINTKCDEAVGAPRVSPTAGQDWIIITLKDQVFVKEYFDGNTYYNNARQTDITFSGNTENILAENPGERIELVHSELATKGVITWPGDEGITNFQECTLRAAMCCWSQDRLDDDDNNGNCATPYDDNCVDADPMDNTDICYADMANAPDSTRVAGGYAIYTGELEGDTHCHGFAWSNDDTDASAVYKGNNLFDVALDDHLRQRGYVNNIPGAPMCGCLEKMPVVSRADCTQVDVVNTRFRFTIDQDVSVTQVDYLAFNSCQGANGNNNDLEAYYEQLVADEKATDDELAAVREHLVDDCTTVVSDKLDSIVASVGNL